MLQSNINGVIVFHTIRRIVLLGYLILVTHILNIID
jgi:hypothetical protein